jgi:hypothetical protein
VAKLHEVLAVEGGLKKAADNVILEGINTFNKKQEHFFGHVKTYAPKNEDDTTAIEAGEVERSEIVTTVDDKLRYVFEHIISHIDSMCAKDSTNQLATADIVINGVTIASKVPAVTLLSLETEIVGFRKLIEAAPSLPPGKTWELDPSLGNNIYKMKHPEVKIRTRKELRNHVKAEATDRFPAQVDTYTEDIGIGTYVTNRICGGITPAHKSVMLGRVDLLLAGVKKARQRANSTEVVKNDIGKQIADFILT